MKNWIWLPLMALAGLLVGSWGSREDLRLYKEREAAEQISRKASRDAGFNTFTRLANIPDVAQRRPRPVRTNVVAATEGTTNAVRPSVNIPTDRPRLSPEDLRARIDEAAELWRTRVELASVRWKERLGATDEASASAFDTTVSEMNAALREELQALADEIASAEKVTPELGLRLMGDVSRIMTETYDALGEALPDAPRDEISEMPVFEFIDPSVAEPLIEVQDKLDGGMMRPPHRP